MSGEEFSNIILPLTAFLAANSGTDLLKPQPGSYWNRREPAGPGVRARCRLDPRFFRQETALDAPLMALLRANRRGSTVRRPLLHMSLDLFYGPTYYGYSYDLEASLVISAAPDVQREPCMEHVNHLLRSLLRPGYICPLTDDEREELGRSPARSRH